MSQYSKKVALRLDQRYVIATIKDFSESLIIAHLPAEFEYGNTARIQISHVSDINNQNLSKGNKIPLFLLDTVRDRPKTWLARNDWADSEKNPWETQRPHKKDRVKGTVKAYVENYAVIVELEGNGIEAFLHISEVPGENHGKNIREIIHIGDRIRSEVIRQELKLLEIDLSVNALLQRLDIESTHIRIKDNHQKTDITVSGDNKNKLTNSLPDNLNVLIIDDNQDYAKSLQGLLNLYKISTHYATAYNECLGRFHENHYSHIILDFCMENISEVQYKNLCDYISNLITDGKSDAVLHSGNIGKARKFAQEKNLEFLAKPIDSRDLIEWFKTGKAPVYQEDEQINWRWRNSPMQGKALKDANIFLKEMCGRLNVESAMLVVEIREGVYEIRARHNILPIQEILEGNLVNSAISNAIETELVITRKLSENDPLNSFVENITPNYLIYPFQGSDKLKRALVFFSKLKLDKLVLREAIDEQIYKLENIILTRQLHAYIEEIESFAAEGRVAAGILHELRNELGPLRNNALGILEHISLGAQDDSSFSESLGGVIKSTERLQRILNLNLARVKKLPDMSFDLNNLVSETAKFLGDGADSIKLKIIFHPHHMNDPIPMRQNPTPIEQSLINVIENAIYFCQHKKNPRIDIFTVLNPEQPILENDKSYVLYIEIRDNGAGMNANEATNAFLPRETSKGKEGIGMGLYVSKNLMRATGGDIQIESWRWVGTIVRILIPIILEE